MELTETCFLTSLLIYHQIVTLSWNTGISNPMMA